MGVVSTGRRKSSVAVVHLGAGGGGVTVNSEPLLSYFPQVEHRQQVLFPLILTELLGGVAVDAQVRGGGKTGTLFIPLLAHTHTHTCMHRVYSVFPKY